MLGFDSWTGGVNHYTRLIDAFRQNGIDLSLTHLGSWGSDRGRPAEELIDGLKIRDISSYPTASFPAILDEEQAAAVIFLSTDTFAHRAFNRYCRDRKVPTVWLCHGLRNVQSGEGGYMYVVNPIAQFKFASSRILKAVTRVWPTYVKALWRTGAATHEWIMFVRDIFEFGLGRYSKESADDARTDMCCIYAAGDLEMAEQKYGFPRTAVIEVGNPDLIQFGLDSSLVGGALNSSFPALPEVMYIDTGLIYTGNVFKSSTEFLKHLTATREALERQGKRLLFKPHPDHRRHNMLPLFESAGIEICPNAEFVQRLMQSCACIVEPSTVSLIPALLGIPLFLAKYGKLKDQRYGKVLTSYPRATLLSDPDKLSSLLTAEQLGLDVTATMQWINENSGPLPAERMPDRVAEVVLKLINGNAPQISLPASAR